MQRCSRALRTLLCSAGFVAALATGGTGQADPAPHDTRRDRLPERARPSDAWPWGCSPDGAICVHARAGAADRAPLVRTLRAAEAALGSYRALGLPPPLDDCGLGGTTGYDVYLSSTAPALVTHRDGPDPTAPYDRSSGFTVVPMDLVSPSCELDSELARALGSAIMLRFDAAAHPGAIAMHSSYLATLVAPCTAVEVAAVDSFQLAPELPLTAGRVDGMAGSLMFPWFLDVAWGTGRPGAVMTALTTISLQHTTPANEHFINEPDVFDLLRKAAQARQTTLGDMLLDFAVARAFAGSRSDGAHLPDTERYGDMGRPRFEWSVPFSSLPRRLGPLRAIHPTGATFLWLDLADAPPRSGLRFVADWEAGIVFRWTLVKVDTEGREAGRLNAPGVWGNSQAHLTMADLDGLGGVLIVGTNLGSDDRSQPYDPDDGWGAPALYGVTLATLDHAR